MKKLITKSDGTPTKSKVHALQFLEKQGIEKDCLIEENGQFFYEDAVQVNEIATASPRNDELKNIPIVPTKQETVFKKVDWDIPVYDKNNEKTRLFIPGSNVEAVINAKHPAGQLRNKNSFEICIEGENFVMSLELIQKIFMVKGV